MLPTDAASVDRAGTIMKTETERHMLPRSTALGMTTAAALMVMVAAAVPAQAIDLLIGLQQDGVNGGAITINPFQPAGYGTFFNTTNSGVHNPENIALTPSVPLLSDNAIDATFTSGTLVVWMTVTGNLGANLPLLGWWRRRRKALVKIGTAAIAMLPTVSTAWAADRIFLTCGPASGYTYFMEGGLAKKDDVGWKKDGVDGKIQLLLKDNGGVDLISSGPMNNFTYSGDGCTFSSPPMPVAKNEFVIVATCGRHLETFFFRWGDKTGEVVSVDIAATPISNRGGVLQAPCKVGQ
jgi:hypothetical protein